MTERNDKDRVTPIREIRGGSKQPIEQVLGDLNEFFSKMGGGGGGRNGGGGGGGYNGPTIGLKGLLLLVGGIFALAGAFTSAYTVDVGEEGVVTRFGAYQRTTPPGLHFKIPFGVERVYTVASQRDLLMEFGFRSVAKRQGRTVYDAQADESIMLSGDLNVANVEWTVQYRIRDPWKYLFHARNVEQTIYDISKSIMRRVVGDRLVTDILTVGRAEIAREAQVLMQQVLDGYDVGIEIKDVLMQDVTPPDSVKPAFIEVNTAKQEEEQTINNAEREYNKIIPEARGKADRLVDDAKAYAVEVVNRAQGDAANFQALLIEYKKAPDITRKRLYIEALEEIFANTDSLTVVDPDIKGLLPLFQGGQRQASPAKPTE